MRKESRTVLLILLALLCLGPASAPAPAAAQAPETPAVLVERLQGLLRARDFEGYLQQFQPQARAAERDRIPVYFDNLQMTGVTLRLAGVQTAAEGAVRVFVQAFLDNDSSALIESWTLNLARSDSAWSVAGLSLTGPTTRLYKLRIPSGRAVRARRVEVRHIDVRITFADAAVFYDNLPSLETGLVVVGRGRIEFTPSDPNEKHQLELLYQRDRLEDDIESLFIRGSPGFFASNVTVETDRAGASVTAEEQNKAAEVFARNYPRSFTIESSVGGGLLSFLPQGDECVLEFKARKAGEMSYTFYPYGGDEVSLYDRAKDRTVCLYSPQEPDTGQPPLKRMFLSLADRFDVSDYALELSFVPSSSRLSARARIKVMPKVDGLDSLKFRFNPDLEILKIVDAEGRELFYTEDKVRQFLYVYFLSPQPSGLPTTVEVFYRGRVVPASPTTDVLAFGQTGINDKVTFRPHYETFFYTHAGYWYPGPADEDYFTARLTITVPEEWSCVAEGELVPGGRREDQGGVTAVAPAGSGVFTFVSRAPVKYLSFIVGKFDQRKERPGPVPISAYISTEVMDAPSGLVDQAADILDFYTAAFGPYPYEKLGVVLRLWPVYGGHSPASFIVINQVPWFGLEGLPIPADTPVDLSTWEEYFLAHEIAHQWWGQGVSFDSYKDQWLSEGLAQFSAASYLRRRYGDGAYAGILKKFSRWTEKKSLRGPVIMGSRLSHFDFEAYQAIVYDKAALALFMLRDLLGPDVFEAGLKRFFEAQRFRAARTAEFIVAMEAVSGRDLKEFFRGWLYDWSLPDVRTAWTGTPVAGGVRIDLKVTQVKGRFVFPLWVEWTCQGRTGRTLLVVDEPVKTVSFILPGKPSRLRINPDRAVPGKFN